ncbi:molybdate ABC transporter substrate-binding protein [Vibrio sp. PNB22_2_2]|uniref:molybdate ABC transporter substrate-binding protein n=1 Tax=unclassified Vibrio TaxID=2614977 RepID=UPI00406A7E8C
MKAWKRYACLAAILSVSSTVNAAMDLKVYAASSLTNVIDTIAQDFESQYDISVTPVYGGSSSIARQVLSGAPADVVILANAKWMNYLVKSEVVKGDNVTELVRNSLVVITPNTSKVETFDLSDVSAWENILNGHRLAIGNPATVPAGMYAKESLSNLGVWKSVERQVAPAKNVRLALTFVERDETPLGIVYKTDAQLSDKVKIVGEIADDTHADIVYPAALVKNSTQSARFFQYLKSDDAKRVFAQYGFQ